MKLLVLVVTVALGFSPASFARQAAQPAAKTAKPAPQGTPVSKTTRAAPKAPQASIAEAEASGPNADVVDMVKKGVKESTIILFVKSYDGTFDTSAKTVRALSAAGVSDAIIDAMSAKRASPVGRSSDAVKNELAVPAVKQILIPNGVEIKVRLAKSLSSKDNKVGETVQLAAVDDLVIDGRIVIAKDAPALGTITKAVPQLLRRPGELAYRLDSVKAVDGTDVKIGGSYVGQAKGGLVTKEELLLDSGVLTTATILGDQSGTPTPPVPSVAPLADVRAPALSAPGQDMMQGIYVEQGGKLVLLESAPFTTKNTASFIKMAATEGFGGHGSNVIVVKSGKAALRVGSSPVFYFYLQTTALTGGISNPKEFVFARMDADKKERELEVGKGSVAGAGGNTQVKEDHLIDVEVESVKPGVFKVTPTKPLKNGEYCFFGNAINKVFDFGVE